MKKREAELKAEVAGMLAAAAAADVQEDEIFGKDKRGDEMPDWASDKDQPRFTQSRFAHDQHQLPIAVPRAFPAPHQHGDFLVTADERREMALTGAASATARPNEPEERHRLRHPFKFMA